MRRQTPANTEQVLFRFDVFRLQLGFCWGNKARLHRHCFDSSGNLPAFDTYVYSGEADSFVLPSARPAADYAPTVNQMKLFPTSSYVRLWHYPLQALFVGDAGPLWFWLLPKKNLAQGVAIHSALYYEFEVFVPDICRWWMCEFDASLPDSICGISIVVAHGDIPIQL